MNLRNPTAWVIIFGGLLLALALGSKLTNRERQARVRVAAETVAEQDHPSLFGDGFAPPQHDLRSAAKAAIRGTIRDREGAAIVGATICAHAEADALQGHGDRRRRCVRSGPGGHYRIDGLWPVPTGVEASAPSYRPGRWDRGEGSARHRSRLRLHAGQTHEGVDITLEPGGVLVTGVVRDIAGGEIEGAQVVVDGAVTTSGDQGQFEVWVAPGSVRAAAFADGYAAAELFGVAPGQHLELVMTPESVLVGEVVLAADGEPVADALVSIRGAMTRTDGDGRFRLDALEPGFYKAIATTEELYGEAAEQVHLGLGQTSERVLVRMHPAARVVGRVVIAGAPERPCTDGWVAIDNAMHHGTQATLDDEGVVEFRGVLAGEYLVRISCEGQVAAQRYPVLEVGDQSITDLVWTVSEGLAIRGEVVDSSGAPLHDILVRATPIVDPESADDPITRGNVRSEADGSFLVNGLVPGRYELTASWSGSSPAHEPIVVELDAGAEASGLRLTMPAVGSVRGRVVDEHGAPVARMIVRAAPLTGTAGATSRSNDAGEFELTRLPPGKVRVSASDPTDPGDPREDEPRGELVEVVADELVEVVVTVDARRGVITGIVLDADGAPVADAFVDLALEPKSPDRQSWRKAPNLLPALTTPVLSDHDGRFEIAGLPAGPFVVRANRRGGGEAFAEDVAVGSHVELVITRPGELAGKARFAGGGVPERFSLWITDRSTGFRTSDSFFRTDGAWRLRQLPAGTYEIFATAVEGNVNLAGIELGQGQVREDIELVLAARLTLRGRIIDLETGEPVAGLAVLTTGNRVGVHDPQYITDADGRFELEGVQTGLMALVVVNRSANSGRYELWRAMNLEPDPPVQDLGDLAIVARRLAADEAAGDLGFVLHDWEPTIESQHFEATVAVVRPGGPAEAGGLTAGDVIEKVDGHDVLGAHYDRYRALTSVPEGTTIRLELRGGKLVEITAGPPYR
jgi:protocatechuate 3,4-dioxygenase beta subunit